MPSSWSASLRIELPATGELINSWGDHLDVNFQHFDFAIAGIVTKALTGNYTLTTANAGDDEARGAIQKFTGAGPFTVTIPSVSKTYDVWNACTAALTLTTGAGTTAMVQPGEVVRVICDASNVKRVVATDFGNQRIINVLDPVNPQEAATKAYADALAFTANAGILPGQAGAGGWALFSNGSNALWRPITSADLTDTAARDAAALGRAIAFAVVL